MGGGRHGGYFGIIGYFSQSNFSAYCVDLEEKQQEKCLEQILSAAGLADCVSQTVAAREGKIRGACLLEHGWR